MDRQEILGRLDHTLLTQTATWEQIRKLCDEGMKYRTASVCIPPFFVKRGKGSPSARSSGSPTDI